MRFSELNKLLNDFKNQYDLRVGDGCDSDPEITFVEDDIEYFIGKIHIPYSDPIIEIVLKDY